MDFAFSDEQEALRRAARQWFAARYPLDRVAALADSPAGWDPASWPGIAAMGWLDDDLGPLEHAVILEEAGYALYPGPLLTTIGLARPAGYAGAAPATLARDGAVALDGDRLSGRLPLVPDLPAVDVAVVAVDADAYVLDVADATVVPLSTSDRTRRYGDLLVEGARARRLSGYDDGRVRRVARAALACEAVGVAQRCLDLATEHARARQQFGRPIGSYQAVSHRIADGYVALQLARSLAYWASWSVAEDDAAAEAACAAAKASTAEAAVLAAECAIQVLGGQGFTWEAGVHRLYKRAQWIASYDGPPRRQRAELADALLASPS